MTIIIIFIIIIISTVPYIPTYVATWLLNLLRTFISRVWLYTSVEQAEVVGSTTAGSKNFLPLSPFAL